MKTPLSPLFPTLLEAFEHINNHSVDKDGNKEFLDFESFLVGAATCYGCLCDWSHDERSLHAAMKKMQAELPILARALKSAPPRH